MNAKPPTLTEIGRRIDAYLKRFEADPVINKRDRKYMTQPFYMAGAGRSGNRVWTLYVSYQGVSYLTRAEAESYLAWLDAGNVGTRFTQEHELREQTRDRERA